MVSYLKFLRCTYTYTWYQIESHDPINHSLIQWKWTKPSYFIIDKFYCKVNKNNVKIFYQKSESQESMILFPSFSFVSYLFWIWMIYRAINVILDEWTVSVFICWNKIICLVSPVSIHCFFFSRGTSHSSKHWWTQLPSSVMSIPNPGQAIGKVNSCNIQLQACPALVWYQDT